MKKFLAILLTLSMIPCAFVVTNAAACGNGDADGNGKLEINDVAVAVQATLSNSYIANADVNGDGVLNSVDATMILQKVLDSSYVLPGGEDTTEGTTEEPTETTTSVVTDGVIRDAYELTPANFKDNAYFTEDGEINASTNTEKIRVTKKNSIHFKVAEGANVYINAKNASTTDEALRTLYLKNSTGVNVAEHDYAMVPGTSQADKGEEVLYAANLAAGEYYITASNHVNVYSIRVTFDVITTESSTETTTEYEVPSEITTTGNKIEVSNYSELKTALNSTNVDIYVLNDIDCTAPINITKQNANVNIIGVTQADGSSPSLDFSSYTYGLNRNPGESGTGIRISGSYYNFENLIVEKAANCGMRIKGTRAGHVFVKDCVFRYNNNSGVSVTSGGEYTTFIGVDSYRNGDIIQNFGDDADGFSVKVNAGNQHYFYNCRAWDNSDDGWDSFDKDITNGIVGDISYIECLAWHNGKQETFTGEYDYRMGYPLDTNLTYIKTLISEDPTFETNYANKTITSWPKTSMKLLGCTRTYDELYSNSWGGNPNGFKFGSMYTPNTSYRYVKNCVAFDHDGKGYDQNNSKAQFDMVNGISFDNNRNFVMNMMTAKSVTGNVYGFGNKSGNSVPEGLTITEPDEATQESIRTTVHNYRDNIMSDLRNNVIPGTRLTNLF